jgi:hypothetical protein
MEFDFSIVHFIDGSVGIHCFYCGLVSFHPKDVEEKYCGCCNRFHDPKKEFHVELA